MINRKNLIESIIRKLDITPTMYKNATERYQSMAMYLQNQGVDCNIYPQGSFRTGTVIRPYISGKDCDYDLDMVCELTCPKETTTAKQVKWSVGTPLINSKLYSDKNLKEYDRCWTLQYAKVDEDVGFQMDVVPAVHENVICIHQVTDSGVDQRYASEAISITDKQSTGNYLWSQSNPLGYAKWFDEINAPFLEFSKETSRSILFEENRKLFASVEDVPELLVRSSLQRVIQILKRHRDIYYSKVRSDIAKPISAIITTLATKISKSAPANIGLFDLLQYVVDEMYSYSPLLYKEQMEFEKSNATRQFVKKTGNKWSITNPTNPNDNYTENWNSEDASYFFRWIKAVKTDFVDTLNSVDEEYFSGLERGFGKSSVDKFIEKPKSIVPPLHISQTKPWSNANE